VGLNWDTYKLKPPTPHVDSLLIGQGSLIDASKCGSGAYRNTRVRQNLMHCPALERKKENPYMEGIMKDIGSTVGMYFYSGGRGVPKWRNYNIGTRACGL